MDFSLFYFADDATGAGSRNRYRLLLDGARIADAGGLAAIWTPERHFDRFGGLYPNPAVTGAALAVATERIGIRAGSVVSPLHHPARIVEDWSVVDNLSGGRVGLSFASGWHTIDFSLRPEAYRRRRELVVESIGAVRDLWRGKPMEVLDGKGAPTAVTVYPPPVQDIPPMWLTSAGSVETFRAAGQAQVGVLTYLLGQDRDELAGRIAGYRAELRAGGSSWPGHVVLMMHTYLAENQEIALERVREPLVAYLTSSFHLIARSAAGARAEVAKPSPADIDFLVRRSLNRYIERYGLFGTVRDVLPVVEQMRGIGVDEIACLVDFGLPVDLAKKGVDMIVQLNREVNAP